MSCFSSRKRYINSTESGTCYCFLFNLTDPVFTYIHNMPAVWLHEWPQWPQRTTHPSSSMAACVKLSTVLAQAFGYTVPSFTSVNCNWQILYNVTVWQWKPADYYRALSLTEGFVPSYSLDSWMFWWAQSLCYQYRLECKQWKMDLVIHIQGNLVTKHNIICASIITLWESGLWFGLHGSFGAHSCRWFITLWLHACIRCLDSRNKNEQSRQDGSNEHWLLVQCSVYISSANQPLTVGWQFTHVQCKVH